MKYRKRRAPGKSQALGELIPQLLAALGGDPVLGRLNALWLAWADVLGPELAALAKPLGRQGTALVLQCSNNMLMQETHLRAPEILRRVNEYLQAECFESLRVCLPGLGRARGGPAEKKRGSRKGAGKGRPAAPAAMALQRPTGRYLAAMDPLAPAARAYAAFSALKAGD